ncbi:MAG: SMP-30/gluconolactonase/LRE family protein [Planctomycetota bacterium]|nr:SMP-30/gluconolactonase/LRE family protein [Planctomycetota bacterium]
MPRTVTPVPPHVLSTVVVLAALAPAAAQTLQSPALPDAVVDLRTDAGVAMVSGQWRYTDAHIVEVEHRAPGPDNRPGDRAVRTDDLHPKPHTPDFDSAAWQAVSPDSLEARRTNGRLSFGWYRFDFTMPRVVGAFDPAGATVVLELVVDDYAEVWVNGELPTVLGQHDGPTAAGWNTPTRVQITRRAAPGERVRVAILAANAPLSDPPPNYVWVRSATLDFYAPGRGMRNTPTPVDTQIVRLDSAIDRVVAPGTRAERLADGFVFTEGPVWVPTLPAGKSYGGGGRGGYLLFSDPNKNVIHRYDPADGAVSIFRTKSGYSGVGGVDIGAYHQPGSNGLALGPDGRLAICEHGNRRVSRLEPNGAVTVLADRFEGKRLNSPNDLVYRSDGTLYFTDPPFGLPKVFNDPAKELPHSGVYMLREGTLRLAARDLSAPNGLAFSPDEKHLYVDNWDEARKVILRYDVAPDGTLSNPVTFVDITAEPGEICYDGLKVDAAGHIYVSAPTGIRVHAPSGQHLGTIVLPELPANFAFGDDDRRTLYITARSGLYRVRVLHAGR